MSIDVSLIVVSFGDPEVLFNSLGRSNEHLKRADSLGYEIIIIDNFSSEEYRTAIVDRLKNYRDESTRFILNTKNLGFGASCNIGAREAKGKFLWFINPDAWIEDLSGIKSLLAFAEQ
ncbi:MAG: glycosyltransferase [Synechococcus sp. WH 8007]|nr:glycosyltransferase [Synechococcus sp. WH 8007]